ncbi:MAG: phosphatidylinositol 3 and 4-kinase-domain-containing protein [Benjaminiella poitrasii]|nr:MAG: phosphatidylinositol 3 and 4-kinase-domain-containing protein [Benjaminiella poitrasii]
MTWFLCVYTLHQHFEKRNAKYSRLDQYDDEEEGYEGDSVLQHPNSVLVSNHHGLCNVVPLLSQTLPLAPTPHHSPPHSPRPSLTAATHVTRRFFQTKLPIVFRKDMGSAASFSSLPAAIVVDLQNGHIPTTKTTHADNKPFVRNDQGWVIVHRRRFRGKDGVGESRHPNRTITEAATAAAAVAAGMMIDEEIDPSDQVTCSVFVKWQPSTAEEERNQQEYTMTASPLFGIKNKDDYDTTDEDERLFHDPIPETEERFKEIVKSIETAIENNMQPTRISQGSSGSYFCRNTSGKIMGVFKPKNEEPYGRLNPKWTKWIHRHLFPCFFGRSCLIPNLGYLSEAAASLIDRKLGTMVVPYTDVIRLSSPSFHYDYLDRHSSQRLPPKIGSFQCFLHDYKDATVFFRDHPFPIHGHYEDTSQDTSSRAMSRGSVWGGCLGGGGSSTRDEEDSCTEEYNEADDSDNTHVATTPPITTTLQNQDNFLGDPPVVTLPPQPKSQATTNKKRTRLTEDQNTFRWTPKMQRQFRREFEQLIILDYLIRNTDRGLDNWMIKYCPPKAPKKNNHRHSSSCSSSSSSSSNDNDNNDDTTTKQQQQNNNTRQKGHIHIAAIDNGLAFPYKHPDQWRSYPYGWIAMPDILVSQPFSEATRRQFLPLLSDPLWWRETVREMRALFELDSDFDERMFQRQMAVLKGQGFNIVRTLKDATAGPIDLVAMQRVVVRQEEVLIEYDQHVLQNRDLRFQQQGPLTVDLSTLLKKSKRSERSLRTKRSTSFDLAAIQDEQASYFPSDQWKDRIGRNKKKKNKYRAFDSDGDITEGSGSDNEKSDCDYGNSRSCQE